MINESKIRIDKYSHYPELYDYRNDSGLAPQTLALAFLLDAAGMSKLFTREDMHEFIMRIAILFWEEDVIGSFFRNEYLMKFQYHGREICIMPDDFRKHIGMQFIGFPQEPQKRSQWLFILKIGRRDYELPVAFKRFINQSEIRLENNRNCGQQFDWFKIRLRDFYFELNNARILADNITKEIDEIYFTHFQENNAHFYKKVENCREIRKYRRTLEFDINRFSKQQTDRMFKLLFPDIITGSSSTLKEDDFMDKAYREHTLYVAWLFANGFVWDTSRCIIDPSQRSVLDETFRLSSGMDLKEWYCKYHMEKVIGLLKEDTMEQKNLKSLNISHSEV